MNIHPTRLQLERLSVGDLPASQQVDLRTHVDTCERCGHAMSALEQYRVDHFAAQPAGHFMDRLIERRTRNRWWRRPLTLLLPAASLAAIAIALGLPSGGETRYKGGGIDVLRRQGAGYARLGPDQTIEAGDELGFVVVRTSEAPLAAWAVDSGGRVDPLTDGAIKLPGGEQRLPTTAIIETPCRDLSVVISDDPTWIIASADVLRRASLNPSQPGLLIRRLRCR